jgi:hypothetical protein
MTNNSEGLNSLAKMVLERLEEEPDFIEGGKFSLSG